MVKYKQQTENLKMRQIYIEIRNYFKIRLIYWTTFSLGSFYSQKYYMGIFGSIFVKC